MKCSRCQVDKDGKTFIEGNTRCDRCRKYVADYYTANRAAACARARKSQSKKSRDEINAYKRQNIRKHPITYMLYNSRSKAKRRGIEFTLTREDIQIPAMCPVLGVPLKIGDGCVQPNSPTIDRIDSSKGYVRGNVQIISHRANTMKNDATLNELRALVRYLEELPCCALSSEC